MSGFADSILLRHTGQADSVRPRIRGRFEPDTGLAGKQQEALFTGDELLVKQERPFSNGVDKPFADDLSQNGNPPSATASEGQGNNFYENSEAPVTPDFFKPPKPEVDKADNTYQETKKDGPKGPVELSPERFSNHPQQATAGYKKEEKAVEPQGEILKEIISEKGEISRREPDADDSDGRFNDVSTFSMEKSSDALFSDKAKGDLDFSSEGAGLLTVPDQPQWLQDIHASFQQSPESSRPVIKVTIGRVDVRAAVQPEPAPQRSKPAAKPRLSLDDYLKQRNNPAS